MSFLPSFDRNLVGRIKKYMSEHRNVTADQIAEDLQQIYRNDYGRRKRNAFRKLVKQIHRSVIDETRRISLAEMEKRHLNKRRKEDSENSGSESVDDDLVEYSDPNSINSSITSLYKKQRKSNSTPSSPFRYFDSPAPSPKQKGFDKDKIPNISSHKKGKTKPDAVDDEMIEMKSEDLEFGQLENTSIKLEDTVSSNLLTTEGRIEEALSSAVDTTKESHKLRKSRKKRQKENTDVEIKGDHNKTKFVLQESNIKFDDIGGNKKTLKEVCNLLIHVKHPEIYKTLGVIPPRGILLHGPPGCGKSLLANAIAGELDLPLMKIAATEIVSGVSGESEQKLREVFEIAQSSAPCIVFIDEIDAITPKREIASKDMERRIVSQLLSCLDDLNNSLVQILVIGATNRPDSIDPALRRAGRFDREVCLGIPDEKAREDILKVLCKKLKLEPDFNYPLLARLTPGYVGADLMSLCREAAVCAVNRILAEIREQNKNENKITNTVVVHNPDILENEMVPSSLENSLPATVNGIELDESVQKANSTEKTGEWIHSDSPNLSTKELLDWLHKSSSLTESQLENLCLNFVDFEKALPSVQPSAKREGFATVPDVTWDDVGALEDVRDELAVAILAPVRNPDAFAALGLSKPPGILLAGPPGCGKTLLAKAIANESGINFISVKGPELLNMYVGESERAVRQCFERARNSAPCVVFFDELDSLCPRRSGSESASTARVVNQMLTEMDGLETRGHVFVMAATNRPDIIDPAVLRPGRLDKTLYVGMPKAEDRLKIIRTLTRNGTKPPISNEVSLETIACDSRCDRFTGADLSSLVREAAVNALKDHISSSHVVEKSESVKTLNVEVKMEHFDTAFTKVKPSVSGKDEIKYEKMRIELSG